MPRVRDVAAKIASKGRVAIAQCKRVLFSGEGIPLDAANALETQAFAMLFGTTDQREGMKGFLEKRKPAFTGN
jgi:enoyl-CoA hydratase